MGTTKDTIHVTLSGGLAEKVTEMANRLSLSPQQFIRQTMTSTVTNLEFERVIKWMEKL